MIYDRYSVLMSVYYKEQAQYLKESMNSIYLQTIPTNDFVLVCDGKLTDELYAVISEMQQKFEGKLNVIKIDKNSGLGNALNLGIKYCKNELIARMDSDDISRVDRCEKQLEVFRTNPNISIVSGIVEEFSLCPNLVESKRVLPEKNEQIIEFAKKRNPFNHPCVMYRKSAVENAGGYKDFYLLEDYYLWIRMLMNGSIGYNLTEPLLWMRAGSDLYKRRSGWKYAKSQVSLFFYMKNKNFINCFQLFESLFIRLGITLAPNWLRERVYKRSMRK